MRRTVDILLASLLLAAALPVLLLAAAAIAIASPGSPLYSQRRVGRGQRLFTLYKLRTMRIDADHVLTQYLAAHPDERADWIAFARLRRDPRLIPGIGHVLRRFSIDEIPQFANVVIGDMSLVGPRPLEPAVANQMDAAMIAERSRVAPGVTGLWQVTGRSDTTILEMLAVDREYLRTRSWHNDLLILLRTPHAVLTGRGAY